MCALLVGAIGVLHVAPQSSSATLSAHLDTRENAQNIPLLRGFRNISFDGATGGGGVAVVDGSVLRAVGGPSADGQEVVPETDQISVYVVKEGDSLSQIADMFGVSMNTIVWANDLGQSKVITPGQKLIILPISGLRYTIEEGDTLSSIAEEFSVPETEITQFNDIYDNSSLAVGETLIIPGATMHTPESADTPSAPAPSVTPTPAPAAPQPSYAGYFIRPVRDAVRSQGIHGYNAVDLAAPAGTPIMAAADGTAIISRQGGWNGGYGTYIVIRHNNGTQTLYAHNSQNIVGSGQQVVQGQVIGYVGSTGQSTGPHVHFEVRGGTNPF